MKACPRATLLLVEAGAGALRSELLGLGYAVLVAGSGGEAAAAVESRPDIDLVLLDLGLGGEMDGVRTARLLLELRDLPLLFLVPPAGPDPELGERAELVDSYGYAPRDSAPGLLDSAIRTALRLFAAKRRALGPAGSAEEGPFERLFAERLIDSLPGIFYLYSYPELRLVRWNRNHEVLLGFAEGEIAGRSVFDWHPSGLREAVRGAIDEAMAKGFNSIESPLLAKDGSPIPFMMTGARFEAGGKLYLMGIGLDIRERLRTEEALRESRETLAMILDTVPQSIFWKDREGRYLGCNKVFARAVGLEDPTKVVGLSDYDLPWSREEAEAYRADDREVISRNLPKLHIIEPLTQADGTRLWIDTSKTPLRGADGRPYGVLGVYDDFTERKLAAEEVGRRLEEKEILLREVHHRIKNNIASIEGVLAMQLDEVALPEAKAALRDALGRVGSMRILYEKLLGGGEYREGSTGAYLGSLVASVLALFPEASRIELATDIADFVLPPRQLFSLGIILNELLTNIMKYAFVGRGRGRVSVSLNRDGRRVTLVVADDGVGLPGDFAQKGRKGLGLLLVEMLCEQLGGKHELSSDRGTRNSIEFDLPG